MSLYDYERSKHISAGDEPFYAIIMAAMRQADTDNTEKLRRAWPDVHAELTARYHAPGGRLENEEVKS